MQQRSLGSSGLKVSRLGLGTATWGRGTDEHEARDQMIAFSESGGTLVDSASAYNDGQSETMLGRLIGDVVARDEIVISTKAGISRRGGHRSVDTSRGHLLRSLEDSLTRLGTDHVDLWQVHMWSDDAPLEETLAALDHAVSSGKATYIGISNYAGWQTAQAATWLRASGRTPLVSTQVQYSLLAREAEYDILPAADANGLGLLAWSPLAGGVLTGKYRTGTPSDSRGAERDMASRVDAHLDGRGRSIVEAVCKAADGLGWQPLQVALAWLRDRPGVTAPILGARTAAQLHTALAVESLALPRELAAALDDVSAE
ncbi:aldo/keto reductase [Nocardioides sp.]|uniref:aldo/keto reductase n=1 Tax=Nocardioides sp. TaxID=35761 RepID=UPI00261AEFFA|nr:aldo/keto reductase [Nocardioides sp.]